MVNPYFSVVILCTLAIIFTKIFIAKFIRLWSWITLFWGSLRCFMCKQSSDLIPNWSVTKYCSLWPIGPRRRMWSPLFILYWWENEMKFLKWATEVHWTVECLKTIQWTYSIYVWISIENNLIIQLKTYKTHNIRYGGL